MKGKSEEKINIPSNSKKYHIYKNSYDHDQLEKNIPLKKINNFISKEEDKNFEYNNKMIYFEKINDKSIKYNTTNTNKSKSKLISEKVSTDNKNTGYGNILPKIKMHLNSRKCFNDQSKEFTQYTQKPSDKYTKIKSSDPFVLDKKNTTNFSYVYSAGGIPCRIQHGAIKLKLKWDIEIENLEYDPILIICFEGLSETKHPYNFVARQSIKEMLSANGAYEKVLAILPKLINPLRSALMISNVEIFDETLDILNLLSNLVKDNFNQYLRFILQQINKNSLEIKFRDKILDLLKNLEKNGGLSASKEIKKKIPTFMPSI